MATKKFLLGFFLTSIFLTSPLHAAELIVEPEMGLAPIRSAIDSANNKIDLVMYGFTELTLLDHLIKRKNAGLDVKVFLEEHPYRATDENKNAIDQLKANHIDWQGHIANTALIHEKSLILDNDTAIVMTFNFTKSTFRNERNFGLKLNADEGGREIAHLFKTDWEHLNLKEIPANLVVSPINSREKITHLISSAKDNIEIYAENITDYDIVGLLADKAKKGVQVRMITSNYQRPDVLSYLTAAGASFHQCKNLHIHAKVILVDNAQFILGSVNLSKPSMETNRELSVLSQDKNIVQQLSQIFANDWQNC